MLLRSTHILLVLLLAMPSAAWAQKGNKGYSAKDLQKMYSDHLRSEGYLPEVDEDGDVRFKREGKTYFIAVEPGDTECFRLVLANIWEIESEEERQKASVAIDHCNATAKVTKAYFIRDNVWVSVETFIAKPEDFKVIFKRCLTALDHGVGLYVNKMRE